MPWGAWATTVLFTLLWGIIAIANASILRAQLRRKEGEHSPSFVPFLGGIFAVIAAVACPWHSPWRIAMAAAALLLDIGSLPFVLVMLAGSLVDRAAGMATSVRSQGLWRRLLGTIASAPRVLQAGFGFLLWMSVWIGGASLALRMGWEIGGLLVAFMLLFWPLYIALLWFIGKYRIAPPRQS